MSEHISQLSTSVLHDVFDERDPVRRAAAIKRIFAPDALFIDHNGASHGHAQIDAVIEGLHALLPDFRFSHLGAPRVLDGAAQLVWQFGPASAPAKISGSDTILVKEGRVSVLLVFLDSSD
jgi:hypothetical protein